MSAEKNKALVRRFLEAHAKGDLDTLEEMLAPDFVDHNLLPGQRPGREGYLQAHTEYHAAYSQPTIIIFVLQHLCIAKCAHRFIRDRHDRSPLIPVIDTHPVITLRQKTCISRVSRQW